MARLNQIHALWQVECARIFSQRHSLGESAQMFAVFPVKPKIIKWAANTVKQKEKNTVLKYRIKTVKVTQQEG
jgi:hypothetical protein